MDCDDEHDYWDALFSEQRELAYDYMRRHNAELPTAECPACGKLRHCPGLSCPRCGYCHIVPLSRVRDTEWGYEVIGIGVFDVPIFAKFVVQDDE